MTAGRDLQDACEQAREVLRTAVMLNPGSLCRSKEPIMRFGDEEKERLCRVIGSVPAERWRSADMPEYKVELVSAPVTAFRREADLVPLPAVDRFEFA